MVKFLGSLVLAAGLAVSAGAGAATHDLGVLPSGVSSVTETVSAGSFSDIIDFTLGGKSSVGSGVTSTNLVILGSAVFNITNLSMSIYNSSNVLIGSGTDVNLGVLGAGSYYAVITGKASGALGGMYTEGFTVRAVPEASTWAMMLAGLGMLAFIAKRRKV